VAQQFAPPGWPPRPAISTYMGHANIGITLDRYGHLMPGNEEQATGLLEGYLKRAAEEAARESAIA
jgi:integrase